MRPSVGKSVPFSLGQISLVLSLTVCRAQPLPEDSEERLRVAVSQARRKELSTAFTVVLDRNGDGVVERGEAALGIRALGEGDAPRTAPPRREVECRHVVYALHDVAFFIDCVAARAQRQLAAGHAATAALTCDAELAHVHSLAGAPDDLPPPGAVAETCEAARHGNAFVAAQCPQLTASGRCRITCADFTPSPRADAAKDTVQARAAARAGAVHILITSDWHIEPWFDVDNNRGLHADGDRRVSRYRSSTATNLWQCRHGEAEAAGCKPTGINDPPEPLIAAHLSAFADGLQGQGGAIFFLGDVQSHQQSPAALQMDFVEVVRTMIGNAAQQLLQFAPAARVFIVPGNNDGPHNSIFCRGGDPRASAAWANVLVEAGIVDDSLGRVYAAGGENLTTVGFFRRTGYYLKVLHPHAYVAVLNTNLGAGNTLQNSALHRDLAWAEAQDAHVYVLGHHRQVLRRGVRADIFPAANRGVVKGVFAGHVHFAADTTTDLFTQVGAISQGGTQDNMFFVAAAAAKAPEMRLTVAKNGQFWSGEPGEVPAAEDWVAFGVFQAAQLRSLWLQRFGAASLAVLALMLSVSILRLGTKGQMLVGQATVPLLSTSPGADSSRP